MHRCASLYSVVNANANLNASACMAKWINRCKCIFVAFACCRESQLSVKAKMCLETFHCFYVACDMAHTANADTNGRCLLLVSIGDGTSKCSINSMAFAFASIGSGTDSFAAFAVTFTFALTSMEALQYVYILFYLCPHLHSSFA